MKRTFHEFCLGLIDLPDWMVVTGVTVEREGREPFALAPGEDLPLVEEPFSLRIDIRPEPGALGF